MEAWTAVQTETSVWKLTWTPTGGKTYEVWLDGTLLTTTAAGVGTYTIRREGFTDAAPPAEVHEVGAVDAESKTYPPYIYLQWRGLATAHGYRVEKQVAGIFVTQMDVAPAGVTWHAYRSQLLGDQESVPYRITALNIRGNAGTAINFTALIVRNPTPPEVAFSIAGGQLVVGAV